MKRNSQYGGAAMEYILVTTFAAIVTMASLTFIGKTVKNHLATLAQKLGAHEEPTLELPFEE